MAGPDLQGEFLLLGAPCSQGVQASWGSAGFLGGRRAMLIEGWAARRGSAGGGGRGWLRRGPAMSFIEDLRGHPNLRLLAPLPGLPGPVQRNL